MAGFFRNMGGTAANQVAAGNVYNPYRGTYAPGGVTGTRMGIGAAQQLGGPIGTIGGLIANWIYSRKNADAKTFDAGMRRDQAMGGHDFIQQTRDFNQGLMNQYGNPQRPVTQGYVPDASFNPGSLFRPSIPNISYGPSYGGQNPGGVTRQTFAVPQPGAQVSDLKDIASLGQVTVNGPAGNATGNWATQAMGGLSQGGGIGHGWTGVSGDAARSMFDGMSRGASSAIAQAEYNKYLKNIQQ